MRVCVAGNHLHVGLTYGSSRGEVVAQASAEPTWPWQGAEKAIVVARLEEDVSWLLHYFSEIPSAVYQSQDPGDPRYFNGEARSLCQKIEYSLHILRPAVFKAFLLQKGREALGWLHFIIDNYHQLPETTVFIHAHRSAASNLKHRQVLFKQKHHTLALLSADAAGTMETMSPGSRTSDLAI